MSVLEVFDTLKCQEFPAIRPICSIAARMRFDDEELGAKKFRVLGLAPDGSDLFPPIDMDSEAKPPKLPGGLSTIQVAIVMTQLKFQTEGRYSFCLEAEGRRVASVNLLVLRENQPSNAMRS